MQAHRALLIGGLLALASTQAALSGCEDPTKSAARASAAAAEPITAATSQAASAGSRAAPQGTTRYVFDQSGSKIGWVGSKITGKHEGGFGVFQGTVDLAGGAPENGRVEVKIDTGSITSDAPKLTGHLKSPDFFDTDAHAKASFVSTKIQNGGDKGATHTVTGDLTIKGITKAVTFPATIRLAGDTVTVDAQVAINRRDFSLNYAGRPNDLIRDEVLVTLSVQAKRT